MITTVFYSDAAKVLTLFVVTRGSSFNRKEIQEYTKLNNVPLDNGLARLVNTRILTKKRNYSLNLMNTQAKKIVDILSQQYILLKEIPFAVYFSIMDVVDVLSRFKNIEIYLFGSYSKLVFKEGSDIDIAVLSEKKLALDVSKIESKYKQTIDIHHFNRKEFHKNKKDPLVKDILKNGARLI